MLKANVRTHKIIIICQILFTEPHQNLFLIFFQSLLLNECSVYHIFFWSWKDLVFILILLLVFPCDNLSLFAWIFVWAKSQVKLTIVTNFVYVFEVNNLILNNKNCDNILDTFSSITSKSWKNCSSLTFMKTSDNNGIFM